MVTKKKTVKKTAARKSVAAAPKSAAAVPKKKGVAAKRKPKAGSGAIALGESLVISNVLEWKEKMIAAISNQDEIVLDGGEIEQIDGTGLQLMVGLMKEAASGESTITWKSASEVLCKNAAQLGLSEILSLEKDSGSE
jgi:anti-anti-sigma regulatory factor